jgi:hypothetical protein
MKLSHFITMNIGSVDVKISAEKRDISDYLLREFHHFTTDCIDCDSFDIEIEILNSSFSLPYNSTKIINTTYVFDGTIAQQINARGHSTWILYKPGKTSSHHIAVYLPYKIGNSNMEKLFSASFLTKWQSCLVDFFHGPFLGILQIELLKRGNTFLHASAYCTENGKTITLAGNGKSGKSTFVGLLTEGSSRSIIAEDFCIIDNGFFVISYPKQCRVYKEQLNHTSYYNGKGRIENFFDKLNFLLFSPAKIIGLKPKRRLSFDEIYDNRSFIFNAPLNAVVFLKREGDEIKVEHRSKDEFVKLCVETMLTEFNNLTAFSDYLSAAEKIHYFSKTQEGIIAEMQSLFSNMYDKTDCYVAEVPFYDNLEFVNTKLSAILNNL